MTFAFSRNPGSDDTLNSLRYLPAEHGLLAQTAVVLCELADIRHSLTYDADSGHLTITLGLGFGHQFKPDFKYSDPYSQMKPILSETAVLLQMFSADEKREGKNDRFLPDPV